VPPFGEVHILNQSVMDNSPYSQLLSDVQSYFSRRYDLFLVRLLEKVSRILGLLIAIVVVLFLSSIVVIFGGIALAYVLGQWLPMWAAYLIIGAVFTLLLVLAIAFRKQLFVNPIVGVLSAILFANDTPEMPTPETTTTDRKETDYD